MRRPTRRLHEHHLNEDALRELSEALRQKWEPYFRHLAELCSVCRAAFLATGGMVVPQNLEEAVSAVLERVPEWERFCAQDRVHAGKEFEELMQLEPTKRVKKIHRAIVRFTSPVLVDLFLAAVQRGIHGEVERSLHLVECAEGIARRIPSEGFGSSTAMTCLARVRAHRGNIHRILGELVRSEGLLTSAATLFEEHGNGDPLVRAEIASFLALLRRRQGRHDEAIAQIDDALALYFACGHDEELIRELVTRSHLLTAKGDLDRAIETSREVLAMLDLYPDDKIQLMATHNLAYQLELSGRLEEALTLLVESKPLYQQFPEPWAQFRYAWSQGRILRELGQHKVAEGHLKGARGGFAASGAAFDLALVSLDLALLYLKTGNLAEIRTLCIEALPIFKAQMMNQEAMAAWLIFGEAVKQEALNAELVQEVMQRIEKARNRREPKPN